MKWSKVFEGLPTALIVEKVYGLTDKKSRAYKSASRQVQREKRAESEGRELKSKPQTRERFERAAEQLEKERKEKERFEAEAAAKAEKQLAVVGRAYNELTGFDPGTKVVITITRKDGTGLTLGRHGGVDVQWLMAQTIPGGLGQLANKQGYGLDPADWALIEFEDYEEV